MSKQVFTSIFKTLACFLLLACYTLPAAAQSRQVRGKVTEKETGEPLPGASVQVKGTSAATLTDAKGEFVLSVSADATTLVISFIGFKVAEVPVTANVSVALEADARSLQEVVVVGYQTMRKSDITGAIASVKASELNLTTPTVGQALVGKVAGVQISQVSGTIWHYKNPCAWYKFHQCQFRPIICN